MTRTANFLPDPVVPPVTPWSLRAWPPLLWQLDAATRVRFRHLDTRITFVGDASSPPAGQTVWATQGDDGSAGMAWDWVEVTQGIVTMADPMSVITNLRLLGGEGEVLTAYAAARYLNEFVRALPWQSEVHRALRGLTH
ncbi:MAG: hypothetical protein KGL78_01600 [Burkholderiales bacterium]|nr:hypothetical protein [Burkholderiales bacterium]